MKKLRIILAFALAIVLLLPAAASAAQSTDGAPDYGARESWAYYALGEDRQVDVFLICPTVDTRSEANSFDLNERLREKFVSALDMEKGIYADVGRLFSPFYRQMSMNAYRLSEEARAEAQAIAYADVSAAFRWYLDHENAGRGLILAGFSQGAQMCLELMKEYFGEGAEAAALREQLIAVYAIGWSVTEQMAEEYPQIVPAQGETDVGTVVCFDCEDGTLSDTLVIPAGTKALSINPLNWKTDGTPADRSLNLGAVMSTGAAPIPALCGARLGARGELVVTDVTPAEYPAVIDIFPEGSYHIYDYMFFFENLRENVAKRVSAWSTGLPFGDVAPGAWYADAVKFAYERGLMAGTAPTAFSPAAELTRAQLVTILWRWAGERVVNGVIPFPDVGPELWYTEAVRWAVSEKIADGEAERFGPADALTRSETARLFWNCAKALGADVSVGEDTNILSYEDAFEIPASDVPALQWAVGSGLMQGDGAGRLDPAGRLTRAQAAVLLSAFGAALRFGQPLSLWAQDAPARGALIDYVDAVTDEDGADYIPAEDRIAVFDLDGTLFCETDPDYFDYMLLLYRVLEDPDYKDRASAFEREVADKILAQQETGASFPGLELDHGRAVASAFAGMTVEAFNDYIQAFKRRPMPSYTGMTRGDAWYLPMLQVVDYLRQNDFTVYVVSGTDRLIVRGIAYDSPLGLPNRQIIGSDETIVSSNQDGRDGLDYVFAEGDELVLGGSFLIKNLKMNKVSAIIQEIGQQPVLSFGNSTGDSSMAEYVTSGNPRRSMAFMLCCDDTARERGSEEKAQRMYDLCGEFGWVPVSMKNDWLTIYGDGVTYTGADPALRPAA